MSEELDRLLGDVRQEGALDSEGRFTLDPVRALELMSRFALPYARRYILNLVSWAAASGATYCVVETSPGRLVLYHDGTPPTLSELENLYTDFGGASIALRELAIGVYAASGLKPLELSVEGAGVRMLNGKAAPAERERARFELRESGGWFSKHQEIAILRDYALFPIRVNKSELDSALELPQLTRAVWMQGPAEGRLRLRNLPAELATREGPFDALVGLPIVPLLSAPIVTVVRGVRFEIAPVPGVFAVAGLPHAVKDLSQSRLVLDPAVSETIAALSSELMF